MVREKKEVEKYEKGRNVREITWKDLNFARFYGKTVNGFFPEGLVLEEHLAKSFHATLNDDSKVNPNEGEGVWWFILSHF
jgi:hypothetical protein